MHSTNKAAAAGRPWWAVLAALPVILLLAIAGGRWYLRRSIAPESGTVAAPGLSAPVEVTFDPRGVPQVWAATDGDAYYALGHLHAAERLFQMELIRRIAEGRLAELFGARAFPLDEEARRMGFFRRARRDVARLDPATRALLARYLAGINDRISGAPVLPPEFLLLRFRPAPWTLEDVAAVAMYQTYFSNALMDKNDEYALLIRRLGPTAQALLGGYDDWSPSTVAFGTPIPGVPRRISENAFRMTFASNSWVIAPSRSASGAAIHESDPHLQIDQAPGLWYLVGLHSQQGLDVVGVTAPGLPFVAMGHNAEIAWAFTVAPVDIVDQYRETLAGDTAARGPGGWDRMAATPESILVKGEAKPRVIRVLETPRGVITERSGDSALSIHWAGFDFPATDVLENGFRLMKARNYDAFRRAVTGFAALSVNWTYSDIRGHIGYQLGTPIPIRGTGSTFVPRDATDPAAEWRGYVPRDRTPHAYDPDRGWLATCNNQPVPPGWPYPLPGFYDDYRIVRASALLSSHSAWTDSQVTVMQRDLVSSSALRFKALMAAGAERIGDRELAVKIGVWDGEARERDTLSALFAYWRRDLTREIFEDELGTDWQKGDPLVDAVITKQVASLIDDRRTAEVEGADDISGRALSRALEEAAGRPLGEVQALTIRHPLAASRLMDVLFRLTRGPFPLGGDATTLDASYRRYDPATGRFDVVVGPSMRYVLDWARPDQFSISLPLGESGNPLSPHFDDFLTSLNAGEGWTVPVTRDSVYARAVSVLRLVPEPAH